VTKNSAASGAPWNPIAKIRIPRSWLVLRQDCTPNELLYHHLARKEEYCR